MNKDMKTTFIVGFEGGKRAEKLADFALEKLIFRGGGKLILLHVVDWSDFEIISVEELSIRHSQRMDQIANAENVILQPEIARLKKLTKGVDISFIPMVKMGRAAEVICNCAEDEEAAQIIIGHQAGGILASLGLGSVAYGVLQKTKVPVTIIP